MFSLFFQSNFFKSREHKFSQNQLYKNQTPTKISMKRIIFMLLLCSYFWNATAQSFGFEINEGNEEVRIPFEIHNNFIVVTVVINNTLPLKFIFDTGAEHTILSKSIFAAAMGLSYDRPIRIVGADLNQELIAYVSTKVHLRVGNALAPRQDILILADDYFKIDEYVGMEIHGIVGADLFRNLVLKIDYKRNLISIQRSSSFKKPRRKKWKEVPITIEKNKPYLQARAQVNDKKTDIKLLIDTGASLSLLLHTNTKEDLKLPKNFVSGSIGRGLGGILSGFLGRLNRLEFGAFHFDNIITNYQDLASTLDIETVSHRNGILGNALIRRFNIIIDYPKEKMYVLPHRRYNKGFKFDKSGLELIVSGEKMKTILVYNIIADSPAREAGIRKGDEILSVNYIPVRLLDLNSISRKLSKRSGKKIRIKIKRRGETMIFEFKLKNLI